MPRLLIWFSLSANFKFRISRRIARYQPAVTTQVRSRKRCENCRPNLKIEKQNETPGIWVSLSNARTSDQQLMLATKSLSRSHDPATLSTSWHFYFCLKRLLDKVFKWVLPCFILKLYPHIYKMFFRGLIVQCCHNGYKRAGLIYWLVCQLIHYLIQVLLLYYYYWFRYLNGPAWESIHNEWWWVIITHIHHWVHYGETVTTAHPGLLIMAAKTRRDGSLRRRSMPPGGASGWDGGCLVVWGSPIPRWLIGACSHTIGDVRITIASAAYANTNG